MTPEEKTLSDELASEWGEKTRKAIYPLSALLAETLTQNNNLAFSFVVFSVAGVVNASIEMARQSAEQGESPSGTVH